MAGTTDTPSLTTLYQGALSVSYSSPLLYQTQQQADQAETAHANDIEYWKGVYPQVELRAIDNPDVDFRLFDLPWQSSYGNPPLVFVNVTPRKKELPKTSGILQDVAVFAPVIALIPVVGTVASIALSVASAVDQKDRIQKFIGAATSVTASEFEPQYNPAAFPILLPLPWAQQAVKSPWLLPSLWDTFKHQIAEAQRAATQALMGEPSNLTLSPNLNPTVLSVSPPGTTPTQDQWLKDLYGMFGQSISQGLDYKALQNTWLTGNASGNPVADAAAGGAAAGGGAGGLWLAIAGIGAIVLGSK